MIDLYYVITPLFSFLALLNLIVLKLTLKSQNHHIQPFIIHHIQTISKQKSKSKQQQPRPIASLFCFFIKNMSLVQIFITRTAKNKIPIMLTLALTSIGCFIISSIYMFIFMGTFINIIFFIIRVIIANINQNKEQTTPNLIFNQNNQIIRRNNKVKQDSSSSKTCQSLFYTACCIISISSLIFVSVQYFKDYKNQALQQFLINCAVNSAIDFLSVQPLVYLILSLTLSRIQSIQKFIQVQQQIQYINSLTNKQLKKIEKKQLGFHTAVGISPKKKRLSPSKVPKVFDLTMIDNDKSIIIKKSKLESCITQQQSKLKKQNQAILTAIQMSKKIKKQRKQLAPLMTPHNKKSDQRIQLDEALNHTNQQLKVTTPIAQLRNRQQEILNQNYEDYPTKRFNFNDIKTLQADKNKDKQILKPTNDKLQYLKKAKTQNDEHKTNIIKSPNLKSPNIRRSPYQSQFQDNSKDLSQKYEQVNKSSELSKKNTLNKSKTDAAQLKIKKSQNNDNQQQRQGPLQISTQIVKMNLKKTLQDLQMKNKQRINRYTIQNKSNKSINISNDANNRSQRKSSQKNSSFLRDKQKQRSITHTIESNLVESNLQNSRNKKVKVAHNNFNNDFNQDDLDSTPNKFYRKKTISDIQQNQDNQYPNKINLFGRNTYILQQNQLDDQALFNENSDDDNINDRMPVSYNSAKKRKQNGLNDSFQIQRDKTGFKNTLLQIRQQTPNQIQQLDMNSPEKRIRKKFQGNAPCKDGQGYGSTKRPQNRKYSSGKRRVIKFSNGEPYLQYLPNMLSKQFEKNHQKKSHNQLKIKQQSHHDKKRKSIKRLKNTRDPMVPVNDQNDCPQFRVEDL